MKQTFVLDSGAAFFRLGLAGEDVPAATIPSVYGTPTTATSPSIIVGEPDLDQAAVFAQNSTRLYSDDGKVRSWPAVESLLDYSFKAIDSSMPDGALPHPVLVAENMNMSQESRASMAQILFREAERAEGVSLLERLRWRVMQARGQRELY